MRELANTFQDQVSSRQKRSIKVQSVFVVIASLSLWTVYAQQSPPEATPQRPTFTNDTSTTEPGTLEIEFGATGPANRVTLPAAIKFTPPAERGLFHRMEFSLGFDSLERVVVEGEGKIKFGESLDLMVRRRVWSGQGLSLAVAPKMEFFLRGKSGALIGGKGIAVYGFGLNSLVVNVSGMGATSPSDSNPGWVAEIAAGYGRALSDHGTASRFSVAFEVLNGFSKGQESVLSLLQGLSYRPRPDLVFDLAVEQRGLRSGKFEMVLQGGLTYNIGRIWPQ